MENNSRELIKRFIYICYNRKETLDIAFEDHKIANVHLMSSKNYNFFTKDTEGQYPASVDNFGTAIYIYDYSNILITM